VTDARNPVPGASLGGRPRAPATRDPSDLKQLTAEDVSLWKDKVDQFGGTELDAAVNIILLDDYFDKEQFQRDKLKVAIGASK
jgi:hypothetical protein